MDSPNNLKEFEITGVSRSGRVRKKSSKLMDFRSPDEIEPKHKKSPKLVKGQKHAHESVRPASSEVGESDEGFDTDDMNANVNNNTDSGDENVGEHIDDIDEDTDENCEDRTVSRSLYMSEKSNKKRVYKDGKIVVEKVQRKDKGKSRFTAYMLWARDVRKNVGNSSSGDSGNTPRKLGEMWANVPANEKSLWRRKAKRLAGKNKHKPDEDNIQQPSKSKFINRAVISKEKKIAITSTTTVPTSTISSSVQTEAPSTSTSSSIFSSTIKIGNSITQPGAFKVTGIEPIDVAAHLKLLGDSLSIIGERLKEHEGQITVSGSLSVLLDSLLCSIGPLICLCTQIPGLEHRKVLNDNLHATLDNIAYVMPGL